MPCHNLDIMAYKKDASKLVSAIKSNENPTDQKTVLTHENVFRTVDEKRTFIKDLETLSGYKRERIGLLINKLNINAKIQLSEVSETDDYGNESNDLKVYPGQQGALPRGYKIPSIAFVKRLINHVYSSNNGGFNIDLEKLVKLCKEAERPKRKRPVKAKSSGLDKSNSMSSKMDSTN